MTPAACGALGLAWSWWLPDTEEVIPQGAWTMIIIGDQVIALAADGGRQHTPVFFEG